MSSKKPSPPPAIVQKAQWIWPDNPHWDLHNVYAQFRKNFQLKSVPKKAPLYVTADQSYQLYINGKYVCRGPARGFQESWPYDTVDVAKWLRPGKNLIAARAHNPGFSNFQYLHKGYASFLLAAKWGETTLISDASWKTRRQSGVRRDTVPCSMQLFPQEEIDLRVEDPNWVRPGYSDTDWTSKATELAWNCLPWYNLEPRGIPMLDEKVVPIGKVIGQASGASNPNYKLTRNLTLNRSLEGLSHRSANVPATELRIPKAPKGGWNSHLIDLGKTHVGSVILDIEGASGGEIIETHHFETYDEDTLCPDYDPDAHCRMAFSQRLTCRKGRNHHDFYHPFGFRYMVLTVRDNKAHLTVKPTLRTALYPHEIKGQFKSSDTVLTDIWKICAWTERVCCIDAYVDTPWREQAQWWGDARVQAWNTFHLSGDARLFRRGIGQIASQTTLDGLTYGHAPTTAHGCVLPDFTLIWILTLWDYYWQTGSLEPFQEYQTVLKGALNYFEGRIDSKTGLISYDPRFWLFLDWTGLHKTGCSSVLSLWYLHALDRLSQMYELVRDGAASKKHSRQATELRKNLRKLINADGLMQGGYTDTGTVAKETSVHAQTLALLTNLSAKDATAMLEKRILPYVRGTLDTDIQPSSYWITYVYSILSERGHGADVISDICKRWEPMVAYGTTWENFNPRRADQSFSHAWSAHPLFHSMQIVGGIRQSSPGWKSISVQPTFLGDSAEVVIPSPIGKIHSSWKRTNHEIRGMVKLPKGMKATLILPDEKPRSFEGSYRYSHSQTA